MILWLPGYSDVAFCQKSPSDKLYTCKTQLVYRSEFDNLDEEGLEGIARLAIKLRGAKIEALGFAPKIGIRTSTIDQKSFNVALSAESKDYTDSETNLENAVYAYLHCLGAPYSVKGSYHIVERVLLKFDKTLLSNPFSFISGKLVVGIAKEKSA